MSLIPQISINLGSSAMNLKLRRCNLKSPIAVTQKKGNPPRKISSRKITPF